MGANSDSLGSHKTFEALNFCFKNNIILYCLPSYIPYKLQPCDISVFTCLKDKYCNKAEKLFQGDTDMVSKQHFTFLYSPSRSVSLSTNCLL